MQNRNHSQSYDSLLHKARSIGERSPSELLEEQEEQDLERRNSYMLPEDSSYSVSDHSSDSSIANERNIHHLHDATCHDTKVIRHHHLDHNNSKFGRRQFHPQTSSVQGNVNESKYPTFVCPNCGTRQRQFFTVSSAPKHNASAGMFITLGFAGYVVASLYIFGLQEGWGKLDCIYFAVITLTTAGLGDLVPTSNGAKIICSIYIYLGVAFIGLLLGSYIAGMLDERSYQEAVDNQTRACPNCTRFRNIQYASDQRRAGFDPFSNGKVSMERVAQIHVSKLHRASKKARRSDGTPQPFQSERLPPSHSMERDDIELPSTPQPPSGFETLSPNFHRQLLGSPMTSQILQRQSHTRHASMDIRNDNNFSSTSGRFRHDPVDAFASQRIDLNVSNGRFRQNSVDMYIPATVNEAAQSNYNTNNTATSVPPLPSVQVDTGEDDYDTRTLEDLPPPPLSEIPLRTQQDMENDDLTVENSVLDDIESLDSEFDVSKHRKYRTKRQKDAKYVIDTLREALANSLVIIAFGCLGFYLIEGFSLVDSWYFTTVLLTSTGYGDIVPRSDGGKLFATVYLLVAGTILLNNMSMISMIPLELRKRRTERAVISQFGDSLDEEALRELATGPLVQHINLERRDPRGLDECTREMFALAMMMRLGKVTEKDIKHTFAAFRKLDVNNEGVLNSKSIIAGMIHKRHHNMYNHNHDKRRWDSQARRCGGMSQGYGSWMHPVAPSHVDGAQGNRNSSSNGSGSIYGFHAAPNSQVNSTNYSDQTPLLFMSERGQPQHGNRHRTSTSFSMNE